jgi:transcriptional regulator with XRE-family HTH domain
MDNKNVFAANLRHYMYINNKSRKDVCEALGFSYYTFSDWVKGKKYPRMDKVEMLANYFGCLKSDLIEDKTKQPVENELSEVKRALIDLIESLSESEAAVLLASLKSGLGR